MESFHPACYLLLARLVRTLVWTKCALVNAFRNATSNRYDGRFEIRKAVSFSEGLLEISLTKRSKYGTQSRTSRTGFAPARAAPGASFFQESQMKPANRTEEAEQTNCSLISEGRGRERGEEERGNETWEVELQCNIKKGSADKLILAEYAFASKPCGKNAFDTLSQKAP